MNHEYKIVPLKLLEALQKLADETEEANLRLSIEEAIKVPSISYDAIDDDLKLALTECEFYL